MINRFCEWWPYILAPIFLVIGIICCAIASCLEPPNSIFISFVGGAFLGYFLIISILLCFYRIKDGYWT